MDYGGFHVVVFNNKSTASEAFWHSRHSGILPDANARMHQNQLWMMGYLYIIYLIIDLRGSSIYLKRSQFNY